ncbi:hypothetical protein BTN49_2038 [Candidatus Enterovibrio escicola]|uniref:Uncharacterized protein n=1 Tax=Candidatus Enterovibrio escicola TaxID=1927127 RepID=A0A2A5T2B7_9GAMM|nr:hypothetical protein BTN49_2038 [Candidatus Enterovibrio escacola]
MRTGDNNHKRTKIIFNQKCNHEVTLRILDQNNFVDETAE